MKMNLGSLASCLGKQHNETDLGPIVGHTTDTACRIWSRSAVPEGQIYLQQYGVQK